MEVIKKFILILALGMSLGASQVMAMGGNPLASYEQKGTQIGEYFFDGYRWRGARGVVSRATVYEALQAMPAVAADEEEGFAEPMDGVAFASAASASEVVWPSLGSFAFGGGGFGAAAAQAVLPGKTKITRKDIDAFAAESLAKFRQVEGRSASAGQFRDFLTEIIGELERELGAEYLGDPRKSRTNAVALYQAVNGLLQSINDVIALQPAPVSAFAPAQDHVAINIEVVSADAETDVRAQSTERESWRSWAYRHRWKIVAGVVVSVAIVGTVAYIVTTGDVGAALEALQERVLEYGRMAWQQVEVLGGNIADFTRRVMAGIRTEDFQAAQARIAELTRELEIAQGHVHNVAAQAAELPGLRGTVGDLTEQAARLAGELAEANRALQFAQAQAVAAEAAQRAAEEAARLAAEARHAAHDAWTVRATHEATGLWSTYREGGFAAATQRMSGWFS